MTFYFLGRSCMGKQTLFFWPDSNFLRSLFHVQKINPGVKRWFSPLERDSPAISRVCSTQNTSAIVMLILCISIGCGTIALDGLYLLSHCHLWVNDVMIIWTCSYSTAQRRMNGVWLFHASRMNSFYHYKKVDHPVV